jgi:ABC-2 type transport system permease protein/oleandomycin transport system permease protein
MFVVLFTYVFGGAIAGSADKYLQFSLAGLIVQNVLFMTLYTGIGLNSDLHKGVFDRLRSLPIARSAPLAGRIVADMVKQVWSITVLVGFGMLIGFRPHNGIAGVLEAYLLLIVFGLAFSWVAVLIGTVVSEPEKVQMLGFVLILPLTFASNAFVPTHTMPGWLQAFVEVNPVTILSDAVRGLMVEGPTTTPVLQSVPMSFRDAAAPK